MNPSREEALFSLALEKPVEKRAAFLEAVCESDTALRAWIEALLAAHEQPETLLAAEGNRRDELHESPIKGQGLTELSPPMDAPDEAVGQTLGRYKLLEWVGEGGCGVVYIAEQTEPVQRRVALKVIKLGMADHWNGWCNSATPGANPPKPPSGNRNWPRSNRWPKSATTNPKLRDP